MKPSSALHFHVPERQLPHASYFRFGHDVAACVSTICHQAEVGHKRKFGATR